jgi:hypothetical protein
MAGSISGEITLECDPTIKRMLSDDILQLEEASDYRGAHLVRIQSIFFSFRLKNSMAMNRPMISAANTAPLHTNCKGSPNVSRAT